jgi:kynurenine formamidase
MKIRSFVIAYALVLVILLFADRRPGSSQQDRYSRVVDLTDGQVVDARQPQASTTRIIAPGALIPGTWNAGQIPAERLIAPLVVVDVSAAANTNSQISLDDIAAWETKNGMIPPGAVVALRHEGLDHRNSPTALPITGDAAKFLLDARSTIGFAVETSVDLSSDRTLSQQLALHGNYVVEGSARFTSLPATGSLIIVAPAKNKKSGNPPVRILAMVR